MEVTCYLVGGAGYHNHRLCIFMIHSSCRLHVHCENNRSIYSVLFIIRTNLSGCVTVTRRNMDIRVKYRREYSEILHNIE